MFPFTRVPFWVPIFDPQPNVSNTPPHRTPDQSHRFRANPSESPPKTAYQRMFSREDVHARVFARLISQPFPVAWWNPWTAQVDFELGISWAQPPHPLLIFSALGTRDRRRSAVRRPHASEPFGSNSATQSFGHPLVLRVHCCGTTPLSGWVPALPDTRMACMLDNKQKANKEFGRGGEIPKRKNISGNVNTFSRHAQSPYKIVPWTSAHVSPPGS